MVNKRMNPFKALIFYRLLHLMFFGLALYAGYAPVLNWIITRTGIRPRGSLYDLLCYSVAAAFIAFFLYVAFDTIRQRRYYRLTGRNYRKDHGKYKRFYQELVEYFQDSEPHKLQDLSPFPKKNWRTCSGIILGKIEEVNKKGKAKKNYHTLMLPANCQSNLLVLGGPGSYKTSGICIPNAICFPGSTIVIDMKSDIYNAVLKQAPERAKKILRFCPDAPDALHESVRIDLFMGIDKMDLTERKTHLKTLADILILESGGSDGNYFSSRAKKIFIGTSLYMLSKNPNTSFPDVIKTLLRGNVFNIIKEIVASGTCPEAVEYVGSMVDNSEKNIAGCFDALNTALVDLSNPTLDVLLSKTGHCLSMDDFDTRHCDLYLQIDQNHMSAYSSLFSAIVQVLSNQLSARKDLTTGTDLRPILFILEEFGVLSRYIPYETIMANLATLRSKLVITMIIAQNTCQPCKHYTELGWLSLQANCRYHVYLKSDDAHSSKLYSDLFGEKKVLKICNSENESKDTTTGRSIQEAQDKVFPPEYFQDLKEHEIVYFDGKYIECTKINCYTE